MDRYYIFSGLAVISALIGFCAYLTFADYTLGYRTQEHILWLTGALAQPTSLIYGTVRSVNPGAREIDVLFDNSYIQGGAPIDLLLSVPADTDIYVQSFLQDSTGAYVGLEPRARKTLATITPGARVSVLFEPGVPAKARIIVIGNAL